MPVTNGKLKTNTLVLQGHGSAIGKDVSMNIVNDEFTMKMGDDILLTVGHEDADLHGNSTETETETKLTINKHTLFTSNVEIEGNVEVEENASFHKDVTVMGNIDSSYLTNAFDGVHERINNLSETLDNLVVNDEKNVKNGTNSIDMMMISDNASNWTLQGYPKDSTVSCQGFVFDTDGTLYESTFGINDNKPGLRQIDLSGNVVKQVNIEDIDANFLQVPDAKGEGIAIYSDHIYMFSWKYNKKGWKINKKTFELAEVFEFETDTGNAWGVTTIGDNIVYSTGTDKLYFMNPNTYETVKVLSITRNYNDQVLPQPYLNELEYIDGKIYANIYGTAYPFYTLSVAQDIFGLGPVKELAQNNLILVIDPDTGIVKHELDLSFLYDPNISPLSSEELTILTSHPLNYVINGIAFHDGCLYITGKKWPKILKVENFEEKVTLTAKNVKDLLKLLQN